MKKLYFVAMAASLAMGACNTASDEPVLPAKAELCFSNVSTLDMVTRAGEATDYAGTNFKFNLSADGDYAAAASGVEVKKGADNAWKPASPVYLTGADRTLVAWAPADLTVDATNTYKLTSTVYDETKDLIYDMHKVSSAAATVDVMFKHAYARLTFQLEATNYGGNKILSDLKVSGIVPEANIDLSAAAPTLAGGGTPADLVLVTGGTAAFPETVSALVVPAETAAPTVTCTLDGKTYTAVALPAITSLVAGNEYVATLKVQGAEMSVTSVKVQGWNQVPSDVELK